jgi:peroxiredoxin
MQPDWMILIDGRRHAVAVQREGDALLIDAASVPALLGWAVKDGTLCRADACIPLAQHTDVVRGGQIDLAALAALLDMPLAAAPEHCAISLTSSAGERNAMLQGRQAPDFELADLAGATHRLSDYHGRKVVLVTWASWCGCREDLAAWNAQHEKLAPHGVTLITISQDSRREDAAPFIEAAAPAHPSLLDPDHIVSHAYGLINVPTVIWIDEDGVIARPPRVEHATNQFSFAHGLDCEPHLAALHAWAETGKPDFAPQDIGRTTMPATQAEQQARAHHALAWYLYTAGETDAAKAQWDAAIKLSPHDWTIRRGSMWLRGENPFGSEFAEAWMEWEAAGRPDYAKLAEARAGAAA